MLAANNQRKYAPVIAVLLGLVACVENKTPDVKTGDVRMMQSEPIADKRPHKLTLHGDTRVDEYYWLRDDTRTDLEVLGYLEQENTWFEQAMAPTKDLQALLYKEMTERLDPDESSVPYKKHGWWYYYRYEAGKQYAIHARRKGNLEAAEEILIDGNRRAEGHEYYQLSHLEMSDDQRYAAIAEDTLSRRVYELRILDTQTGEFLPEVIGNADSALAWSADGNYLFYLDKHPETLLAYRVMRHKLGADPSEDALVYEEPDNTYYTWLYRSRSGDYIFLSHEETETSEYKLLLASDPLGEFQTFLPREAGHEYSIDHAAGRFFIRTNWNAANFRVMSAEQSLSSNKDSWTEVIPHRDDAMVRRIQAFDDYLLVNERNDGLLQIRVLALDGTLDRYFDSAQKAYVMWLEQNRSTDAKKVRYGFASPSTPNQIWELDLDSHETTLLKQNKVPGGFDSSNYVTDRLRVAAGDGSMIPVSMVWHQDTALDGSAPVLITAYGSYGSSNDPGFRNSVISLLDRGFVYVIAHVRGGQELGRNWYEQGRLMNKKNTFTDFVDVTSYLQDQNLVDANRTYAIGGSAGGLLMGAVLNMAPNRYHGVIAEVPFVDVVTTMLDETIPLTSGEWHEWGNPKDKAAYEYMLSYSPYDQVSAQDYPHLLVTTGLHDSQVQYFEPAKWVARLRDRRSNNNKLIMRVNMESGHSGVSGRLRQYEELAEQFAFLIDLSGQQRLIGNQ